MRILPLDGLRAVAILFVFLHHQALMKDGWVGVNLFFVLSGYLITGILRSARNNKSYWKPFYLKRAARILPPVLLLIGYSAYRYHPPFRAVMAYLLFMGNFARGGRYSMDDLSLLWSLAVEEHFYLVFPFAVRYLSRRSLLRLLIATVCLEPIARAIATPYTRNYITVYFFTFYQLDGLALGALLALFAEDANAIAWMRRYAALIGWSSLGLYCALWFANPKRFTREVNSLSFNSVGYSLIALTCFALVAYVLWHPRSVLSRVLAMRPFVFLGTISYGFYLYHQAIQKLLLPFTRYDYHRTAPLLFVVAVVFSWLSFRYYEQPIMRLGQRLASHYAPNREASAAFVET